MAVITVSLGGTEKLASNLAQLDRAMQRRVVANALRAAMRLVMRPAVVAASPARSSPVPKAGRRKTKIEGKTLGPLRQSWSVVRVRAAPGVVRTVLKSNTPTRDAFYAIFLETGWLAGRRILKSEIKAARERKSRLRRRKAVPARPFVAPTAHRVFEEMVGGVRRATEAQVELAMREINK